MEETDKIPGKIIKKMESYRKKAKERLLKGIKNRF